MTLWASFKAMFQPAGTPLRAVDAIEAKKAEKCKTCKRVLYEEPTVCAECSRSLAVEETECPDCGARLNPSPVNRCETCGHVLKVNPPAVVCSRCGATDMATHRTYADGTILCAGCWLAGR